MDIKKLLVSFVMLVSFVLLASTVSAQELAVIDSVTIDGVDATNFPAIIVGDVLLVRVEFTPLANLSDVTVRAELEGDRRTVSATRSGLVVEEGYRSFQTLRVEVPFDLDEKLSSYALLTVKISGSGFRTEESFPMRLQREPFRVDVLSVELPQSVNAGEYFPVEVVLRNRGYNNLRDLKVTIKVPALGIERSSFFGGSLVATENGKVDTLKDTLYLKLPYDVSPGTYSLEAVVTVSGKDAADSKTVQFVARNQFPQGNFVVSDGEILIANPTNELVVYRLTTESEKDVSVRLSESTVAIPAGSSRTVRVELLTDFAGRHDYSVNVYALDGSLVQKVEFSETIREGKTSLASPLFILTIILAIVFVVLLVVLIVLVGKKPKSTEEFGESYY